ncbi:ion transporter [Volucribacter amazonae]|uniref:Ion transport domain-containing protein n=1 Tax=Volucribacter amazonae TaxID=256731 RepID=A0A9X4P7R4_9PAST|nr:ion transporter [Volucribacter amazonae]MDG6894200.1 hypothetical protein [Volucribacter amazonae]
MQAKHQYLNTFVRGKFFHDFILTVIIVNAAVIGLSTYPTIEKNYNDLLTALNRICTIIFVIEFILRIYTYKMRFFKRRWDIFDLIVVIISLVPETSVASVFRFLRIIRILRLISIIPQIQFITQVLLKTLSSIFSVGILLMVVYYVYAVIVTNLYAHDFPELFGTINESYYTLFQMMTFDSWSSGIVRPVMQHHPYSWIVFISFIIIATYIVLNIVIGIIVDCINEIKGNEEKEVCEKTELVYQNMINQLQQLQEEIKQLKNKIDPN